MGKKTKKELQKIYKKVIHYRWEFLRRNKCYKNDYLRKDKFPDKYWQERYAIFSPLDPNQKSEAMFFHSPTNFAHWLIEPPGAVVVSGYRKQPITLSDAERESAIFADYIGPMLMSRKELDKISTLKILVDLTRNKEILFHEFKELINSLWRKERLNKRFIQYEHYLKVYDSVEKQKRSRRFSWEKLANEFYKDDSGGIDYAKMKVKRDYRRAKALVEKGYRQIR